MLVNYLSNGCPCSTHEGRDREEKAATQESSGNKTVSCKLQNQVAAVLKH